MTDRRAAFLTARREIRERGRSRAFLISTGLQIAIVVAIVAIAAATGGEESFELGAAGETGVEIAQTAADQGAEADVSVERYPSEAAARQAVTDDEVDAAVLDGTLFTGRSPSSTLVALVQQASQDVASANSLRERGLSAAAISAALEPRPLQVEEAGSAEEGAAGVAFIGSLLLYIAIFSFGMTIATGVVEEKATRVVEVILSAIRPVQLLAGKVLGVGIIGLAQVLAVITAGLLAAVPTGAVELPDTTGSTVALIALFFVLGYLLYACAFAVAGAIVSRQEDVQNSTGPLIVVLVAAYLVGISTSESPDSTLAVVCTFVPPVAPMIVPGRAAQDALPMGELILSVVLMLAATALLLWLAARIYDRAVLRMGSPLKLRETLRLAR